MDRSSTHVKVIKNGIEDWLPKTVWKAIGENDNKDGWILVQDTPPEAIEVRRKLAEAPVAETLVETEVEVAEPVKVKAKKAKV